MKRFPTPSFGRVLSSDANYATYRTHVQRIIDEPFAVFLPG